MRSGTFPLLLGLLVLSGPAWARPRAADKSAAARLVKEAGRLYEAARFEEAAETLLKAQKLNPHPRIVYNIARAYDQAGKLIAALKYYQQYVGSREGTDVKLLKRSALAIERLRGLLRQQEEQRASEEAERRRLTEEARLAQERAQAEAEAKRRAEEEAAARARAELERAVQDHQRARTQAYMAGGVGLAGVVVGVVSGILAGQSKAEFVAAPDVERKRELEVVTWQRAVIADVGFGVGVAGAVAAFLLHPRGEPPGRTARLLLSPAGAGVEVKF